MSTIRFICLCTLVWGLWTESAIGAPQDGGGFTVVTYNVENLFDVDGVALFDDYKMGPDAGTSGYSRRKFQTKLQGITDVLKTINAGAGPEVLLLQELEADFTPDSTVADFEAFLLQHRDQTVASMLGADWLPQYAGYPAVAWLLKSLSDAGLTGYEVVTAPARGMDSGVAHTNAVFSKFPIRAVERHPLVQARDIIAAELDVAGHPLFVYVNHWKSGASNPAREPIRVENARVLRQLLDARLAEDPHADVIVAGDLNSHYNHSILNPGIETGINDVLGSAGDESFAQNDLYNLWFELPSNLRFSEVWRGHRGTLMHMLLTSGLYDDSGISYVDGSFSKLIVPGLNTDAIGRPIRWSFAGDTGSGVSDHTPLYARFRVGAFQTTAAFSRGDDAPDYEPRLNVSEYLGSLDLPDGGFLSDLNDTELAPYVAHLFTVKAIVKSLKPFRIQVGERVWPAYYVDRSMLAEGGLPDYQKNNAGKVRLVVQPNFYYGKSQLIVEDILGEW
ncbi:endonuclease/exonuclease/phosphatase family protein [Coraliomargarita sp. SDUM461004]|uniref:Endonuclease/exonuclease/phosphatase family protein n=1 Tax=Thalassobacterium sedimentorum TaxID=3041258 RepID=A0ABU1AH42_9BACT|nr:endonuclease/exonuclease/phosphatase family protein [Coraliomargarita sp. SDUM461004]MDQ8194069.1 endonuclease/exonuclease/phosphatase family protein [Coraliomargarita sp. SDUM461004]